jgi:predicted esterase
MLSGRVADDAAPVAGLVATPVFMGQGDDDPVVLPAELDPGARSLAAWGARVEKHRYPALAHQVDDRELRDVAAFLTAAVGGG